MEFISKYWSNFVKKLLDFAMKSEYKRAAFEVARVNLSSGELHYLRRALPDSDEVVLLLHGAGTDKDTWLRFAQAIPNIVQVIAPDLPAHGDSAYDSTQNYGVIAQAERMAEFIDNTDWRRVHLVGSSMGGAIALRLVHKLPQYFVSLTLIDSAGAESQAGDLQMEILRTGKNPMTAITNVKDYKRMMEIGMSKPPYIPALFLPALTEKRTNKIAQDQHVLRDITVDLDQRDVLSTIKVPTLIIWGEEDKILHLGDATLLEQNITNSTKWILPKIGHVPMVEAPKEVAQACIKFWHSSAVKRT